MCKIIELLRERRGKKRERERRERERKELEERERGERIERDRELQSLKYVDMWRITHPSPCIFKGSVTCLLKFYAG